MAITKSKMTAAGLAIIYLFGASATGGIAMIPLTLLLVLPPLALIWFSEFLSEFTGYIGGGGDIDQSSPEFLVAGFGWVALIGLGAYLLMSR